MKAMIALENIIKVLVRNGNINSAIRVLKKNTKDSLIELRDKQHYEKPSSKRNKAKAAARIREQKRQRDDKRNKF